MKEQFPSSSEEKNMSIQPAPSPYDNSCGKKLLETLNKDISRFECILQNYEWVVFYRDSPLDIILKIFRLALDKLDEKFDVHTWSLENVTNEEEFLVSLKDSLNDSYCTKSWSGKIDFEGCNDFVSVVNRSLRQFNTTKRQVFFVTWASLLNISFLDEYIHDLGENKMYVITDSPDVATERSRFLRLTHKGSVFPVLLN